MPDHIRDPEDIDETELQSKVCRFVSFIFWSFYLRLNVESRRCRRVSKMKISKRWAIRGVTHHC